MDRNNLRDLERLRGSAKHTRAQVMLFGEYAGTDKPEIVQDPWYGGIDGFETAYEQCVRFTKNFLKEVFPEVKAPE